MSLLSLRIPVRSVLVAPVWPISWMEMAGLVAVDWIGRTNGDKITAQTKITNVHVFPMTFTLWKTPAFDCFVAFSGLSQLYILNT